LDYKQRLKADLMKAAQSGNVDGARKALHQGVDVNTRDKHDRTALMHAADYGHTEVVSELLRSGANPRLKEKYFGRTALMFAMRGGDLKMAKELLDSGAEVNATDNGFETALMIAVYHNRDDLAPLLLSEGADAALRDENNRTAMDMAKYYKYDKLVGILQEAITRRLRVTES